MMIKSGASSTMLSITAPVCFCAILALCILMQGAAVEQPIVVSAKCDSGGVIPQFWGHLGYLLQLLGDDMPYQSNYHFKTRVGGDQDALPSAKPTATSLTRPINARPAFVASPLTSGASATAPSTPTSNIPFARFATRTPTFRLMSLLSSIPRSTFSTSY
ncbi:hypothetical protein L7F22_029351 [Adiantum nelumboides]|nr:hypothetical protein [Adiantum nelumboides]